MRTIQDREVAYGVQQTFLASALHMETTPVYSRSSRVTPIRLNVADFLKRDTSGDPGTNVWFAVDMSFMPARTKPGAFTGTHHPVLPNGTFSMVVPRLHSWGGHGAWQLDAIHDARRTGLLMPHDL